MTSSDNQPPVLLSNRYQVLSVLGDGGFGKTFLVEDTQMPSGRRCVLKQLKPIEDNPQTNQMVKDRFQREAAILEKLGEAHEQIPRLYANFSEAGQFYLVEEWVAGDTLTQRVQREGPLSETAVQTMIAQLLPAIAHVHQEGIVHRDIKPDNIILRAQDGKPVLIDFGAVKETMNTVIDSHAHSSHSIVVGTPGYMPAEQLSGRPVFASDIYSIGMTAIYALTGKIPQELDIDPRTGVLLWRQHAPNVSSEFANFLDCAIHMNAQSRFPVVQEMLSILNSLMLGNMSAPETPFPETWQSSQTVISAPPSGGAAPGAGGAPNASTPAYAYQNYQSGPESINTQVVAPGLNAGLQQPATQIAASGQFGSGQFGQQSGQYVAPNAYVSGPQGAYPSAPPSGQWKNAVIVGGMVGFSVLLGALVVMERLPGALGNKGDSQEQVTESSQNADQSADQNIDQSTAEKTAAEAEANPEVAPVPPSPAEAAPRPPASVPNANASIVGQPGSKNIRAGAGTTFGVIDTVGVGDRVQIVDRNTDSGGNPWYQIATPNGNVGWVAGQLIQVDGDAAPPRSNPAPPVQPAPPADNTNAIIIGEPGSKNIRSGPGTDYGTAHIAYPGDRIVIRTSAADAGGYTWHKVYFPKSGAEGWIADQLVRRD